MANEKLIKSRQQQKYDTEKRWNEAGDKGFIPKAGEIIVYSDLNKIKIGDSKTNVNNLEFLASDFALIVEDPEGNTVYLGDRESLENGLEGGANLQMGYDGRITAGYVYLGHSIASENGWTLDSNFDARYADMQIIGIRGLTAENGDHETYFSISTDTEIKNNEDGEEEYTFNRMYLDGDAEITGNLKVGEIEGYATTEYVDEKLAGLDFSEGSASIGGGSATGSNSVVIGGETAKAEGENSVVIGTGTASGKDSTVIGSGEATGTGATAIGGGTATGDYSVAEGSDTLAGCKGYYIAAIDPANNQIYLYTKNIDAQCSHNDQGTVIPTWDNPSGFYDAIFDSGYQVYLGDVNDDGLLTAEDADLIQQHVAGGAVLSELQQKVADVDKNGGIDAHDAARILQHLTGWNVDLEFTPYCNEFSISSDGYYHWVFAGNIVEVSGNRITYGENNSLNNTDKWINENNKYEGQVDPMTFFIPAQPDYGTTNVGLGAHAEGWLTHAAAQHSHAEGEGSITAGRYGHAEGRQTRAGFAAHSEGQNTFAKGLYSHAEGANTKALQSGAHAEGTNTLADKTNAHAEGSNTTAIGQSSHVEGRSSNKALEIIPDLSESSSYDDIKPLWDDEGFSAVLGDAAHAEGLNTIAKKQGHAEGYRTISWGDASHSEGYKAFALGKYSHVEGTENIANGLASHAEGQGTVANGKISHAQGQKTQASGDGSHAEGYKTIASGVLSHAEGQETNASGTISHAEGNSTKASGITSHAEGNKTIANGQSSHAEGESTIANGNASHAEGHITDASGWASHAEGYQTKALGEYSHSEGFKTTALGNGSHAEGHYAGTSAKANFGPYANGLGAHAEGATTNAFCKGAHAEGRSTNRAIEICPTLPNLVTDIGFKSSSDLGGIDAFDTIKKAWDEVGKFSLAVGEAAHSEGVNTIACQYAHAEGEQTIAKGNKAHAEGTKTQANGISSHAEGEGTIVNKRCQHVQGKYNIEDTSTKTYGKYAHIVGNGTSSKPSNAHTLDWEGNAWFAGNVTVGEDKKELATKEYVDSKSGGSNGTITIPVPGTSTAALRMLVADSQGNMSWVEIGKAEDVSL